MAYANGHSVPREMDASDIADVLGAFRAATRRAREAGFSVIELHAAHGYLIHGFLSPLSNRRGDGYGGGMARRALKQRPDLDPPSRQRGHLVRGRSRTIGDIVDGTAEGVNGEHRLTAVLGQEPHRPEKRRARSRQPRLHPTGGIGQGPGPSVTGGGHGNRRRIGPVPTGGGKPPFVHIHAIRRLSWTAAGRPHPGRQAPPRPHAPRQGLPPCTALGGYWYR